MPVLTTQHQQEDPGPKSRHDLKRIVQAGTLYFAFAFAAGFLLGIVRVLWVAPHYGERTAELLEAPMMLVVIVSAALWVVQRYAVPPLVFARLIVGGIAVGLLLVVEFSVVLWLRGMSVGEYFASRDPVAGAVYVLMLIVLTVTPLFVARR
ncbi:MAG: hypothetical protein AB7G75_13945 [Candidatus Binatia bacterium]